MSNAPTTIVYFSFSTMQQQLQIMTAQANHKLESTMARESAENLNTQAQINLDNWHEGLEDEARVAAYTHWSDEQRALAQCLRSRWSGARQLGGDDLAGEEALHHAPPRLVVGA